MNTEKKAKIQPHSLLKQAFPAIDDATLEEIIFLSRIRTYPANTLLCHEGVEEDVFYILADGRAEITKQAKDEERLLRTLGPGEYFGEMGLIANTPRNANVRTITEATVIEIDKPTFIEMLRQNPQLALGMFQTVISWLRANDQAAIADLNLQKQAVEDAFNELSYQEKHRSEFLTVLAHEIRTPLTTATGFMQLIRNGSMSGPMLQGGLDKVGTSLDRIVSLVNDLLFVQEMELIAPNVSAVNLGEVLQVVVDETTEKASASNLTLKLEVAPDLPSVQADPDGLIRAFRALLDNAIKFSPEGGEITIRISVDDIYVQTAFIDPGIGIEPDFMPRIFERFEHQEKRGEYLFGGVGLGLPIAKHLIESFGGHIEVDSELNRGSVFTVRLPFMK